MPALAHLLAELPAGLTARPVHREDLPGLSALVAAYERAVLGEPMTDEEDLVADWDRPSFDPVRDSVLVLDDDAPVGWAEVFRARQAVVVVSPWAWSRGIGRALAGWCEATARAGGGSRVGQPVPDADGAAVALLRSRGWTSRWTSWLLELPPGEAVPSRALPDGCVLRESRPGEDGRAAYRVIEEAFSEWPDREPTSYEDWAATVLGRPGFEPWQLLLAVEQEEVVGACHLVLSGDTGWVNQLAVAPSARRRGIAQALLARAWASSRDQGAPRAELATDSRTGALTLYERLGMQVRWSWTHWAVDLDPEPVPGAPHGGGLPG